MSRFAIHRPHQGGAKRDKKSARKGASFCLIALVAGLGVEPSL